VSNKKISKKELEAIANENKSCKYILSEIKPLSTTDDIFKVIDNEYKTINSNESLIKIFKAIAEKKNIDDYDKATLYSKLSKYIVQNQKIGLQKKVNHNVKEISSLANKLIDKKEITKSIDWLDEEIKEIKNTSNVVEKKLSKRRLNWTGNVGTLVDIFYQLKRLANKKGGFLIEATDEEITDFLIENFEKMESRTSILTSLNGGKKDKRPTLIGNKIQIEWAKEI